MADLFFYRPWAGSGDYPAGSRFQIEVGYIKNLPDDQSDKVLWLKYADMQGQATLPRVWGINDISALTQVLWNNEFARVGVSGFAAWDPDDVAAGVQSFKDAESLIGYLTGGKTLISPRRYPIPATQLALTDDQLAKMAASIKVPSPDLSALRTAIAAVADELKSLDTQADDYQSQLLATLAKGLTITGTATPTK